MSGHKIEDIFKDIITYLTHITIGFCCRNKYSWRYVSIEIIMHPKKGLCCHISLLCNRINRLIINLKLVISYTSVNYIKNLILNSEIRIPFIISVEKSIWRVWKNLMKIKCKCHKGITIVNIRRTVNNTHLSIIIRLIITI